MLKKALIQILKVSLVMGLLYFLAQKDFLSVEATKAAFGRLDLLIPAYTLTLICSVLGVVRWQWLLKAQGIELPFAKVFQLNFIGNFFNIALPGAVSGDFVKAFYIANDFPGSRGRAFGSILFDRVAGLSALVMVSAIALLIDIGELYGSPLLNAVLVAVVLAAVGVVVFFGYLFVVKEHNDPVLRALKRLELKFKRAGSFVRIYEGIRHYHNHKATVAKVLAISMLVHILIGTSCILFLKALFDGAFSVFAVFVVVPLGLLVTAVPILPAGVGTGHAAFGYLFSFLGTQRGGDVFTLVAIGNIAVGAIGGLIYLRYKSHSKPLPKTLDEAVN